MKLYFKQRIFSWFDSYDIYDEDECPIYTVRGELSWGHCFRIYDANGDEVGMVKERIFTFLPKFEFYIDDCHVDTMSKHFSFVPTYSLESSGWKAKGDLFGWDYSIVNEAGQPVAEISKQLFRFSDTYEIDVHDNTNMLQALMFVLAIDAEKCSNND